ncbi:permease prefix domain 1-containing protein [Sphaerisporangium sp. TRM90804]|uniref:permease prefix domain 1-containing protein n=1 Tax=Sphaerisporangium sp. TRM90804 TaxID=3031113 RepID=UPI00244D5830|nr:permease prefix domain 1-containing protein [Sphaerisporangium sp. TRM90804]MDH2429576.1 permease prefix domain 1-containing protein [Sphaerisporangium sp. TRM90804]
MGVIDDYVSTLAHALHGPARVRRDMLAEARDSLSDAAEAHLAEGLEPAAAERRAVAEFGTVGEIAPGYQEELTVQQGRRTAATVFIAVPLMTAMWSVIWWVFPDAPPGTMDTSPGWFGPLSRFLDWFQLAMGVFGALALVALGGRARRVVRRPELVTRVLGIALWIQMPMVVGMSIMLTAQGAWNLSGFEHYPPGTVATILSYLIAAWLLYNATRCLTVCRRVSSPAPPARASFHDLTV